MTTVLPSLCYARSNLVQMNMGYYLYATKTSKCTIENLHQAGISVTYKSITRILNAVAASCELGIKQFHNRFPNYVSPYSLALSKIASELGENLGTREIRQALGENRWN